MALAHLLCQYWYSYWAQWLICQLSASMQTDIWISNICWWLLCSDLRANECECDPTWVGMNERSLHGKWQRLMPACRNALSSYKLILLNCEHAHVYVFIIYGMLCSSVYCAWRIFTHARSVGDWVLVSHMNVLEYKIELTEGYQNNMMKNNEFIKCCRSQLHSLMLLNNIGNDDISAMAVTA